MILVTGGAGYVGSVLVKKLVSEGLKVRVFDKFYFGEQPLLALSSKIEIVKGDIREFPQSVLDGIESVIHFAGLSNDPTSEFNPEANHQINTEATIKLAQAAKKKGVARFIFASSCSIYDFFNGDDEIRDEEAYVKPVVPYSLSKYNAEQGTRKLADKDFCVTILRKGTVFGYSPRMRFDLVVNTMVKDAFSKKTINVVNDGLHWRPLVDVSDVANAYSLVLGAPAALINNQIINISLGNFQIKDIARTIQETLRRDFGLDAKIENIKFEGKIRSYRVDNKKAKKLLGFSAKVTIEESVKTIAGHIKDGDTSDFANPIYYNIDWMRPILEKEEK